MTQVIAAKKPYDRRPAPVQYAKGWLDVEHQNIQQGIRAIGARVIVADSAFMASDEVIIVDTTAGDVNLTLPVASTVLNLRASALNIGANTLTIVGTLNGAVNPTFAQWHGPEVFCDGTAFYQIGGV